MTDRDGPAPLHLRGVTKRYGEVVALDGVDLEVAPGLITTLVGPSGCGKSTLLGVVAGLTAPTAGRVHLGGRDVTELPAERRGIVLVFQEHRLFPFLTALEDVAFGLRMRGVPRRERERRAASMLERVGLGGLGSRRPAELSGGQRQRVALARALVLDPQVLLLDEPLASLDPHLRDGLRELVVELQRERALTTLVVTHDREEAVVFGDRLVVLLDGRLHQHAEPRDVVERPATGEVARFIGATEVLPGRRTGDRVTTPVGPLPLPVGVPGPGGRAADGAAG
ncbi:MAG: ABC transporter ATP-binding protein, partial [Nitriliruptor sp.]